MSRSDEQQGDTASCICIPTCTPDCTPPPPLCRAACASGLRAACLQSRAWMVRYHASNPSSTRTKRRLSCMRISNPSTTFQPSVFMRLLQHVVQHVTLSRTWRCGELLMCMRLHICRGVEPHDTHSMSSLTCCMPEFPAFLKLLQQPQALRPSAIMDLIHSAESWTLGESAQEAITAPQR
jgi:hypothetical protein